MKRIFITGTSSGVGKILAEYLLQKGHTVVGSSRNPKGNEAFPTFQLDITDDTSIANCLQLIKDKYEKIDVLINNAGYGIAGSIEDTSLEEAIEQFDTNYFGVVRMIKATLPLMKPNKGGLIINISSMASLVGLPFQGHYSASKFALEGLTEALRFELKPFNINVCNINPGDFKTNFTANRRLSKTISKDYAKTYLHMLELYEKEESEGANPVSIAKLIERLIQKKSGFKVRYIVGNPAQTIIIPIKKLFGDRFAERILAMIWKI